VCNIKTTLNHLTILSLKSYRKEWEGSEIEIQIDVMPGGSGPPRTARYVVEGHHAKRITVSYPRRLRLPGEVGAAEVGDTVRAKFTKVGGTMFKISGIAFCDLLMDEVEA
jgi:hypothetical protein